MGGSQAMDEMPIVAPQVGQLRHSSAAVLALAARLDAPNKGCFEAVVDGSLAHRKRPAEPQLWAR